MSSPSLSLVDDEDGPRSSDSVPPAGGSALAAALADSAELMHTAVGSRRVLDELVAAALRLVPGAQDASVMLSERDVLTAQRATSPTVEGVDTVQLELREGPSLEAAAHARPVRVDDMGQEERWAAFAPQARGLGVVSTLSLPLRTRTSVLGVLNLFSTRVAAFGDESEQTGLLLTRHAAIALAEARGVDNLHRAVAGRDLIGQAKGRLMDRYGLDEARAFGVLRRLSQNTHRKLHDVARQIATTGQMPELTALEAELVPARAAAPDDPAPDLGPAADDAEPAGDVDPPVGDVDTPADDPDVTSDTAPGADEA